MALAFESTNRLYHFTSLKNALKILQTKELWMNTSHNQNDINESYRNYYLPTEISQNECVKRKKILSQYQILSFSMDKTQNYGYDIPAMWGHYANRGHGVCLVFDKDELVKIFKSYSCAKWHSPIRYIRNTSTIIDVEDKKTFPRNLFFEKSRDWSYEQEYRFVSLPKTSDRFKLVFSDNSFVGAIIWVPQSGWPKNYQYKKISQYVDGSKIYYYFRGLFEPTLTLPNNEWVFPKNNNNEKELDI